MIQVVFAETIPSPESAKKDNVFEVERIENYLKLGWPGLAILRLFQSDQLPVRELATEMNEPILDHRKVAS